MVMGRPIEFTEELDKAAADYVENFAEFGHKMPSIIGMSVAIDVARSTLYKWADEKKGNISDTLARCNDHQHLNLLEGGLTNKFNATITKLALANHGYSEKTQQELTGANGGPLQVRDMSSYSDEELEKIARGEDIPK